MIPKTIHYCWFGRGEMPEMAKRCIASWHEFMPDWEYKLWNEDNFDMNQVPYTKEAYEAKKVFPLSTYHSTKGVTRKIWMANVSPNMFSCPLQMKHGLKTICVSYK